MEVYIQILTALILGTGIASIIIVLFAPRSEKQKLFE